MCLKHETEARLFFPWKPAWCHLKGTDQWQQVPNALIRPNLFLSLLQSRPAHALTEPSVLDPESPAALRSAEDGSEGPVYATSKRLPITCQSPRFKYHSVTHLHSFTLTAFHTSHTNSRPSWSKVSGESLLHTLVESTCGTMSAPRGTWCWGEAGIKGVSSSTHH